MMGLEITTRDERTIKVPIPANNEQTSALANWLEVGAHDDYTIKRAAEISGGNQYDPYVTGLYITMEKKT